MNWIVTGTSPAIAASTADGAIYLARFERDLRWDAQPAPEALPRDKDGFLDDSAAFGMLYFVRVTYNTDAEGAWVDDEDWSNVTLHGPFYDHDEAEVWMQEARPDDTEVKDVDVIGVNCVRPGVAK